MDLYPQIFRRKSFHLFLGKERPLTEDELRDIEDFAGTAKPLDPSIRTKITVVPASQTSCKNGAEYCVMFYSEKKGDYLRNVGYIGEQIDLYLASRDIGAVWFGIGKADETIVDGLHFVIMIAVAKMHADKFRRDMFKSKRKPLGETWKGETLGVAEIVRFAPSACNSQPWYAECEGALLRVFRRRYRGKRGIMPAKKVGFYNRIDVGIYILFVEICLRHGGYAFERKMFKDFSDVSEEDTALSAEYRIHRDRTDAETIARVTEYETLMREIEDALDGKDNADLGPDALKEKIARLEAYYTSDAWRSDFAADEAGLLPPDLRRGVLSEDGVYLLLERYREITGGGE